MPIRESVASRVNVVTVNKLLQTLDHHHGRAVLDGLVRRAFRPGEPVMVSGGLVETIWFPETLVARLTLRDGLYRVTTGLVGAESAIGADALLGRERSAFDVTAILRGGTALGVPIAMLQRLCAAQPALHLALTNAGLDVGLELARLLASALHDSSAQRLARWLLLLDVRAGGASLTVTHQELGEWAGLRRASVTDGLHLLEGDHLVRCGRGRLVVCDRAGLQRMLGRA